MRIRKSRKQKIYFKKDDETLKKYLSFDTLSKISRKTRFCRTHAKKTIRKGCLFSCDSGLETKLRFVGKRHCVCLPLHAADAPLGNNIASLMLLRSLRSLQVLLSAPKIDGVLLKDLWADVSFAGFMYCG